MFHEIIGRMNMNVTFDGVVSGGIGGVVSVICCHPFDTVKCRIQTQGSGENPVRYRNGFDCFMQTFKKEGVRGLYKGVLPPLLMQGVINSVVFGVERTVAECLRPKIKDDKWKEIKIGVCGGLTGGFVQSFVCAPMELVKLRTQHQKVGEAGDYKGNWATLKDVYRKGGIRGCYQGFWVTAFRDTPAFAVYFASYEGQMHFLAKRKGMSKEELSLTLRYPFICGGTTGIVTWMVNYPVDLVKSRIQLDGRDGTPRVYRNSWDCFTKAWREGGVRLLYRGLTPTLVRAFANSSSLFVAVELTTYFLKNVLNM